MSKPLSLAQHYPDISRLVFGCMGLGGVWDNSPVTNKDISVAREAVDAALECGINLFDHADIYTLGKAEIVFGRLLKERPQLRKQMVLQSKCGIRFSDDKGPGRYDFSSAWLLASVEGILQRLGIEQLDILLLHRPDPLMEPEEVAGVFRRLQAAGKVRHFGVSNMQLHQIAFLQSCLDEPLLVNQLPVSLLQLDWLEEGVLVSNRAGGNVNFTPGTLEYCRLNQVQIQSWGSMCQGWLSGRDVSHLSAAIQDTAVLVAGLALQYNTSREAIVLAWLMRHPAAVQPVIGTTIPARIKACALASGVNLSREDWYRLYVSARGAVLP
jgi:predicted oxidoreductase